MFCCACIGTCNHTGPHHYCNNHGGTNRRYNPESYVPPPCPSCASLRAELAAKDAALCRARDRDGMAAHIHKVAVDVDIYAEGESVALLVANAAIDFIGTTGPCPHESRVKELEERLESVRDECFAAHTCTIDQAARLALLEKVREAAEREVAAAKLYKDGGHPLQKRIDKWCAAQEELRAALAEEGK